MSLRSMARAVGLAFLLAALGGPALARPKVGLVLGGGGARGAAHIGVLEELERRHVPVDCIAGTSFGALVAGAWVAGVSPAQMSEAMAQANWDDMFQDNPDYAELNLRAKQLLQRYLPASEAGLGPNGVTGRPGVVSGQKIKLFINELVQADKGEPEIGRLPIPLSIVATDIGTGERVAFRQGSLTQAMRASMSVPGLLAPLTVDGRKLVDGGLVDNLPVDEVRERCGAEVVIAVNVGSPLLPAAEVGSLLTVSAQMVALLTEQNVTRSLALLGEGDIYMRPVLDGITAGDFKRHAEAAERGRQAAEAVSEALGRLAVDDDTWQAWQLARHNRDRFQPRVDAVEVDDLKRVDPAVVMRRISQQPGQPLDTAALNHDLLSVYGDGWYESVDYSLQTVRERNILRITPIEKPWGPDYLRFAINLDSTLSQGSTYSVRAAYQRTWINARGGELLFSGELGSRSALGANWYQPLDREHRWFTEASLEGSSSFRDLYFEDKRISRYQIYDVTGTVWLGAQLGQGGQVRAGWQERHARASLDTGLDVLAGYDRSKVHGWRLDYELDLLDRLYFPTRGWGAKLRYFHASDGSYAKVESELRAVQPIGDWVLGMRVNYAGSTRGKLPLVDAATLGGFLNLSAFGSGQIVADSTRYGQIRAERILGRAPLGLRGDLRFGMAMEAARVGMPFTTMDGRSRRLDSLTLYVGGESPIGPVYLGIGHASRGDTNAYLFLGTP